MRMKQLFLVLLVMLGGGWSVYAQALPPIQCFTPLDYGGEYQNWAISQSARRYIYVANNFGLLEYDGTRWRQYPSPNGSNIRSVATNAERVYTGCYLEFGYWEHNTLGQLEYHSLSDSLDITMTDDEDFWDILIIDELVLFQSLDRIYIYDTEQHTFEIITAPSFKAQLFLVGGDVFFQQQAKGLFMIENGQARLVTAAVEAQESSIVGVFEQAGELLFVREDARFFQVQAGQVQPWKIAADQVLTKQSLYTSLQLRDGTFVLGSISNGIYQVATDGTLIGNINLKKGLCNNTVLALFADAGNNLWLGLDNGICVLNLDAAFTEYIDNFGELGTVYAARYHAGYLYLGTNQGLFYKRLETGEDFELVAGTEGQVWTVDLVHGTLFCGHNFGTFVVEGTQARLISDFPGTWAVKPITGEDGLILQGNFNGLSILAKDGEGWYFRNKLEGFDISSLFFEVVDHTIVVNHEFKGIYKLRADENWQAVTVVDHHPPEGKQSNIFAYQGLLYYKSDQGFFTLDLEPFTLASDSTLSALAFSAGEYPTSSRMFPDPQADRLWCFTNRGLLYLTQNNLSGKFSSVSIPVPSFLQRALGVRGFENINWLYGEKYLIGIANGYVVLDLQKRARPAFRVGINRVAYGGFAEELIPAPLLGSPVLDYQDNHLRIDYTVPEYEKYQEVQYQYQLTGFSESWSAWSVATQVSLSNLPPGQYEFRLRARIGNTLSENEALYRFEISTPWYLSAGAIAVYILLLLCLLFLIHRRYRRFYRKQLTAVLEEQERVQQLKRLEANEKLIQMRNEKLQSEIEAKNRELAISTMSILNKNKFLYTIKDQLKRVKAQVPLVKSVIQDIDQNIDSKEDWKVFAAAFDNADQNFLKNIKAKHEKLTPEDLRLCAYLRLNLSSKEIAPLLNISVKSVEMKRYRLRKKLDLPHEENLIDYILSIN
jgi:DNA-binding CsgD family transcriptional regulator